MQQDFLVLFAYHNDRICFDAQRVMFFHGCLRASWHFIENTYS